MTASSCWKRGVFWTPILAFVALLSSCYYSSPVPLPGEHEQLDAAMLGEWEIKSDTTPDGMKLFIDNVVTGNHTIKGYFIFYEKKEDGTYKEEKHSLQAFSTHVGKESLLNVGIDMEKKEDGGYMFARYELRGDTVLKIAYIKESAFKKEDGSIQRFKSSKDLYSKLHQMMKSMPDTMLFEEKEALVFTRPKK